MKSTIKCVRINVYVSYLAVVPRIIKHCSLNRMTMTIWSKYLCCCILIWLMFFFSCKISVVNGQLNLIPWLISVVNGQLNLIPWLICNSQIECLVESVLCWTLLLPFLVSGNCIPLKHDANLPILTCWRAVKRSKRSRSRYLVASQKSHQPWMKLS